PTPLARDLLFEGRTVRLVPRLELGVYAGLAVSLALPAVLHDQRSLALDGAGGRASSATVADGLLPEVGYDGRDPGSGGLATGSTLFRGVDRAGLDQLHVGLVWAALDQASHSSRPTWKLGAEGRMAIGKVARFDRDAGSDGVGRGIHELRLWTSMARRTGWAVPHPEMWWRGVVGHKAGSRFAAPSPRFGARGTDPGPRAGARFGLEAIVFERPAKARRVALTGAASLEARF